jgi:hypothetical protein
VRVWQCRIKFRPYAHDGGECRSKAVEARKYQTGRCQLSAPVQYAAVCDSGHDYLDHVTCETMKDFYVTVTVLYGFGCGDLEWV